MRRASGRASGAGATCDVDMSEEETSHTACVREWMGAAAAGLSPEAKLALFERALGALWERAQRTLGEVTLGAIVDRVLHDVRAESPRMPALVVSSEGVRLGELRVQGDLDGLDDAMRRTLVALLTVIGNLTAEILTPGLHAALSAVSLPEGSDTETGGSTR